MHANGAGQSAPDDAVLDRRIDARFLAQGEGRTDLDPCGTCLQRLAQPIGRAIAPGEPERDTERGECVEVDVVTRPVDRLSLIVEHERRARRRVVPAGDRSLDDEAVGTPVNTLGEEARQGVRGDDRQESRSNQRSCGRVADERGGVESRQSLVVRRRAGDRNAIGRRLPRRKKIEDVRDLLRYSGSHQHHIDARQHRAVQRIQRRELDLLEIVDPDETAVAFLGERDLSEIGEHGQIDERRGRIESMRRHRQVPRAG